MITLAILSIVMGLYANISILGRVMLVSLVWLFNITFALLTPCYVMVGEGELVVKRVIGRVRIDNIASIEMIDRSVIKGSVRTFGVGGFFGFWGDYMVRKSASLDYMKQYLRICC